MTLWMFPVDEIMLKLLGLFVYLHLIIFIFLIAWLLCPTTLYHYTKRACLLSLPAFYVNIYEIDIFAHAGDVGSTIERSLINQVYKAKN